MEITSTPPLAAALPAPALPVPRSAAVPVTPPAHLALSALPGEVSADGASLGAALPKSTSVLTPGLEPVVDAAARALRDHRAAAAADQGTGSGEDDSSFVPSGMVGVSEALYRLRSGWSPALHEGKHAIVALPRPDVMAAYHRNDAHVDPAVEEVEPGATSVDTLV